MRKFRYLNLKTFSQVLGRWAGEEGKNLKPWVMSFLARLSPPTASWPPRPLANFVPLVKVDYRYLINHEFNERSLKLQGRFRYVPNNFTHAYKSPREQHHPKVADTMLPFTLCPTATTIPRATDSDAHPKMMSSIGKFSG